MDARLAKRRRHCTQKRTSRLSLRCAAPPVHVPIGRRRRFARRCDS
jgi:hypothetical protein